MIRLALAAMWMGSAGAHEVPADAAVQAWFRPAGERLQLLIRVPLGAMRDLDFPLLPGGALNVEKLAPQLPHAATLWLAQAIEVREDGAVLAPPRVSATQVSIASDRSFTSFEEALRHTTGAPLTAGANVYPNQLLFDVLLEYPIRSERSAFAIHPRFERLAARVVTVLRFAPPGGAVRAFEFTGDPGLVALDPRWHQAALRFVAMGFWHILEGTDHLLFLACLVIPFRRLGELVWVVTAFTVAHSITLIASAFEMAPDALWFPPFIETLIAASIVYMALENIVGAEAGARRWVMTFGFGLIHGFGFSFALRETLQFAGSHLAASLVAFNLGVELGQLLVLMVLVPVLNLLFHRVVAERMGSIVISAFVAHTGWHWLGERWETLRRYNFEWPGAVVAMRWAMWILILGGAAIALQRLAESAGRRYRGPYPRARNSALPDKVRQPTS